MQDKATNDVMNAVFRNGQVYVDGSFQRADVWIHQGVIKAIGKVDADAEALEYDASGCLLLPGMADVHVHLREPGYEYKETIAGGSRAAAAGGYTLICSMPNLNPAPDSVEHLRVQLDKIATDAVIAVHPYGCITKGQLGEGALVDFEALTPYVCGFSDDGRGVQSVELMREAMKRVAALGGMIVAHCEVNELLRGGYIHNGVYAALNGHAGICSESEWQQVARDLALVRETDCKYHVCHISTKESVALIRAAKQEGLDVSCETAPHYLILCDEDLQDDGRFKMNPPIRGYEDRAALVAGLLDGTIDMIATDHAPHSAEEKSRGLKGSFFGIVGLESAFALMYTHLVKTGVLTLEQLVELMVVNPRKRFGYENPLQEGVFADMVVMEVEQPYTIDSATFVSKGKAQPFDGYEVVGKPLATLYQGEAVWQHTELCQIKM